MYIRTEVCIQSGLNKSYKYFSNTTTSSNIIISVIFTNSRIYYINILHTALYTYIYTLYFKRILLWTFPIHGLVYKELHSINTIHKWLFKTIDDQKNHIFSLDDMTSYKQSFSFFIIVRCPAMNCCIQANNELLNFSDARRIVRLKIFVLFLSSH